MAKLKEKKVEHKKVKVVTQKTKKTVGNKPVRLKVSLKPKEKAALKPKKPLSVKPKIVRKKAKIAAVSPAPPILTQEPQVKKVVSPPPPPPPPAPEPRVAPITKPAPQEVAVTPAKELELEFPITLKDLAVKLQEKPSTLIKILMDMRIMVGINQTLEEAVVSKICEKYQYAIKKAPDQEELALRLHKETDSPENLKPRFPIVTLMGHVDHGKTSLLDAIRKSKVVDSEHGGITQHIGAYKVILPHGEITFLDTPGHEAFTAMRARGASITDIVVLVVAADDGMMPQTEEAIDHARAAGVPIIVAVNKMDKPQADIDRVKKQLSKLELAAEDWGGKTITVPVSAKTGQGMDDLLEMILLEAQMLELKANPERPASGVVIESKMAKGRGPVVTLLIHSGTLHLNENIIVGTFYGKIRAMFNDRGHSVTSVGPSSPVEVLGISGIPAAGEPFFVIEDEKEAKGLAAARMEKLKLRQMKSVKRVSLEDLHAEIEAGKIKELKLIIKADVQGSLEAIKDTLNKINASEIKLDFIHMGVGNINASDAILAVASNALILGFNIAQDEGSKEIAAKEGLDIRMYNIIYELANDIKAALEGMLEPKIKKVFVGRAEIRKVLKLSRAGTVAGCFVAKGKISRNNLIHLVRNDELVFEGKLSSLKRFKDDVREVSEGFECGLTLAGFDDVHEGDLVEAFEIEKIARKL
ncbi:MAG: translation initiation factor IF-2 [Candidatus Omnitrophota bacterium]